MTNPFFDHDEEEDMRPQLPPETLVINGSRKSGQYVVVSQAAEKDPVRDALMLEVFLSTNLPNKTLVILAKLLADRMAQNEQLMAQLTRKPPEEPKKEQDSYGFSPPLTDEEKEFLKEVDEVIREAFEREKSDETKPPKKRGRKPKKEGGETKED